MPVIKEYQSRVGAPGPQQAVRVSADQLGAQEGQATANLGNAVQKTARVMADRLDQENTSEVTTELTRANSDLAMDLQETIRSADPGDKKVFEEYNKRVETRMSEVGEKASTLTARKFFNENSVRVAAQLEQTASQGQAELAGIKAVQDYTDSLNSLSSAASADPSSIGLQKDLHNAAIDNLVATGSLPTAKAAELREKGEVSLVKSHIRGWANLDADYAKKKLESGEFDKTLGADGKRQLFKEIEQAVRAKEIDIERRRKEQKRVQKEQQQVTQNTFLQSMTDNKLTTKDILQSNLEAFGSGSKEQFLNMLKTSGGSASRLKTNGNTMVSLYNRIHLPDGDVNKLTDENELNQYFGNGLGMTDLNRLRDEMQGKGTKAGKIESDMKQQIMKVAQTKLAKRNPLTGIGDPNGEIQLAGFMGFFFDEYQKQRKEGKTAMQLLSPESPDYLGKAIGNFEKSPEEIMRSLVTGRSKEIPKSPDGRDMVKATNGVQTLFIHPDDLEEAKKDGFNEVPQ